MESQLDNENDMSEVVVSSRLSVVDHILYFKHLWRDHWAGVTSGVGTDLAIMAATGVVVRAHQSVLLPLSPMLSHFLQSAVSCECPGSFPTLLLPDWSPDDVRRLLQLVYTGSCVISNSSMYIRLIRLMYDLGLYIPGERLTFAPVPPTSKNSPDQETEKRTDGKHSVSISSQDEGMQNQQTTTLQGRPPEGPEGVVSPSSKDGLESKPAIDLPNTKITIKKHLPGVTKLLKNNNLDDDINLIDEVVECGSLSPQARTENYREKNSFNQHVNVPMEIDDEAMSGNKKEDRKEIKEYDVLPVGSFKCTNCGLEFSTDKPVRYILHERSCRDEINLSLSPAKVIVNDCLKDQKHSVDSESDENKSTGVDFPTKSDVLEDNNNVKVVNMKDDNEDMESDVLKANYNIGVVKIQNGNERRESSGNSYTCYICDVDLHHLNASVYLHYATVHFSDQLFDDFEHQVDGDKCLDCGTVVESLDNRYWFLVHMGVKHKGVEKYLPAHLHLGSNQNRCLTPEDDIISKEDRILENNGEANKSIYANWDEISSCPVCELKIECLTFDEKSDHLYGHFKDQIKMWSDGMKHLYSYPSIMCPQCKADFKDQDLLFKHLGSIHNLYLRFIQKYKVEYPLLQIKDESTVASVILPKGQQKIKSMTKLKEAFEVEDEIEPNLLSANISNLSEKPKMPTKKEIISHGVSKYVNTKISLNPMTKECHLCSKQFSNYHRLRYHYSLVHFKNELEVEMKPLFENNNGSCPKKTCPKVFKIFQFFMYHMGSIHREVDKYVEAEITQVGKYSQTTKKKKPYQKAKYRKCPLCFKKTRSYNCLGHMVTHYYEKLEKLLRPNDKKGVDSVHCLHCDKTCADLEDYIHHAAQYHNVLKHVCSHQELEYIQSETEARSTSLNFCQSDVDAKDASKKKTVAVSQQKEETLCKSSLRTNIETMKTRSNPDKCKICKKQLRNYATLLQHLCGHFRQELKQEFAGALSQTEPQITCPKCNNNVLRSTFILHIGAVHKEVIKYAPWVKSSKNQAINDKIETGDKEMKEAHLKHDKGLEELKGDEITGQSANTRKKTPKSARKRLVFPATGTRTRSISGHNKIPQVSHHQDEECEPPAMTVNPCQANVAVIWVDSDIEGITPLAEASMGSPSTSSVLAPQVTSPGSSSSATTSLMPLTTVASLLDPGDLSELMESAKKAFQGQNKN